MTKTVKALLVSLGALGLIGTGFAAWNITITGETKVERPLSPDTDGTQTLVAQGLDVSEDPTLTFHPNSGAQLAHYVVKAVDTSWYSKVNLLDASEEKVSLKVSFAGTSTNSKWEDRIAIDHAEDRTFAPATWLASSEGYSVDWNFSWKGIGAYANPAEYAQATYATPESQKEYLDAVSADLEGLQFTFTFDLVANTPVGPVNPDPDPDPDPVTHTIEAIIDPEEITVGETATLMVTYDDEDYNDAIEIVDVDGFEDHCSIDGFEITGESTGDVQFKVKIGDVVSDVIDLSIVAPTPTPTINYGTLNSPLSVSELNTTIAEVVTNTNGSYSDEKFVVKGIIVSTPTKYTSGNSAVNYNTFQIRDENDNNSVFSIQRMSLTLPAGIDNLYAGDTIIVEGYGEYYNGYCLFPKTVETVSVAPAALAVTPGISTITLQADEHAHVDGLDATAENGSEQIFEVTVDDGYDLVSVKVNNTIISPDSETGYYVFTVGGDTTVVVTTKVHSDDPTPTSDPVTVSTTIAEYANANEWADTTQYGTVALDSNIIATAAGGGNTGKYYASGNDWRFYANESATLTISVSGSYSLSSVTITYTIKDSGTLSFSENTVASGDAVSVSGDSATFTIGSSSGSKGKVFVTAISVTYVAA